MIELPVYNRQGDKIDQVKIDEGIFGSRIRPALLKQAIVMYHANRRQGSAVTKSRGMVVGSTAKLYRQKGTGRARAGASRTGVRRGGGVTFAKHPRDFRQKMPQKQRRLARNSAILAKMMSNDTLVIDELSFEAPKTSEFSGILGNLKIDRSCLIAIRKFDTNLHKSVRNIPRVDAVEIAQLNAGEILNRKTLLFTREALEALISSADTPMAMASAETAQEETKVTE